VTEYQIQEITRRCSVTGRELQAGERFYSVLVDEAGKLQRKDFSQEAWQGPPPGAFSFWAGRVPPRDEKRRLQIDDDMLVDCFRRLGGEIEASKVNFRYVVALLLMRRKRFKFEEAKQADGKEILVLRCTRTREQYDVVNPRLNEEEMKAVQEEVFKVLGWE
jgi:hypothetical protein